MNSTEITPITMHSPAFQEEEDASGTSRDESGDTQSSMPEEDVSATPPTSRLPMYLPERFVDHCQGSQMLLSELYLDHHKSLIGLAIAIVRDLQTAQDIVHDTFLAFQNATLLDSEKALLYLKQSVVNKSRSVLRHRVVVDKYAPYPEPDMPSAEYGAFALLERNMVIEALRTLPARQQEAIVLRYYGDMSEAQIASAMGISRGAVKSHSARAIAALRNVLEPEVNPLDA